MPEILIPDGCSSSVAAGIVDSYMLFPRDEKQRLHWLASALAHHYWDLKKRGANKQHLEWMHVCIADLWELPQAPRRVYDDGIERARRASLSGHVLTYLLRLALHHPAHCKVGCAKVLAGEFVKFATGEKVSESLIEKAWADFKVVSPLWASWHLFMGENQEIGAPFDDQTFPFFLGTAEEFRKLGEGSRLLLPGEVWKVTAEEWITAATFELRPIEGDQLAFLRQNFPE